MKPEKAKKFMAIAREVAQLSKDPSTKVGAVAINDTGAILSVGYNGFPRGVNDDPDRYANREIKLALISHAEQNLVAQAAYVGVSLFGCTVVIYGMHPCSSCAKSLIQAGIKRIITQPPRENSYWTEDAKWSKILFDETSVDIIYVKDSD